MGNLHDEDDDSIILNLRDEAVVVHAVAPLSGSIGSQPFAVQAWVAALFEIAALMEINSPYFYSPVLSTMRFMVAIEATRSASPRVMSLTPCVLRLMSEISSTVVRMTMPSVVMSMSS